MAKWSKGFVLDRVTSTWIRDLADHLGSALPVLSAEEASTAALTEASSGGVEGAPVPLVEGVAPLTIAWIDGGAHYCLDVTIDRGPQGRWVYRIDAVDGDVIATTSPPGPSP